MKVTGIHLSGIGTARTGYVDTAEAVERGWWGAGEREESGLVSVSVAGTTPAPDLAVEAAQRAMTEYGRPAAEISGVFHTNVHPQGPDGWSAQHYINRHTVNQPVTSVEIHNGCVGFFSVLQLATCYLLAAPDRVAALLTCADNFGTPAVDRWRAAPLFVLADGGGAVVLSKRDGFAALLAVGAASDPELEEHHRGAEDLFPPGLTVGRTLNFGERMVYGQQRAEQGELRSMGDFGTVLVDTVENTLKEAGVSLGDIALVVHDGFNYGAVRAIFLDPLDIPDNRSVWEFTRRTGHGGPLDAIRGLEYAWTSGQLRPGDKVLLLGGAPGMEAACAVVEITRER